MTARGGNSVLRPHDVLDVSPGDARRLGLTEGDTVQIESQHGCTRLPVHLDSAIRPGELFATFHTPATTTNLLTGTAADPITHTPAYKRTAVRLVRVAGQ